MTHDLSELKLDNYVQRLERCQAYRFRYPQQATAIASLLRAKSYSFSYTDSGWILVIQGKLDGTQTDYEEITVNCGDFIALTNFERQAYEIVRADVFRNSFEPQETR